MENYLEKQCLHQNEKSSIWTVKDSEGNHETLINFTKSGNKPKSIDEIKKLLNIIEKKSLSNVILPDSVSETNMEFSFLYKQKLQFHSSHENGTYKYNINQIVLFAIDIALALHEIHSINLIHGEISSNIIIESNKSTSCKLLYFADMPFSDLKANLPYMAPELLSHACVDSRADLYSLGVLLYKLSTGILPCSADETIEMVHQQLAQKPEPPSSINRSIPEPLSEIISKLLEKNPDKRYQTAYGVKQDLILLNQNLTTPGIKNSFHLAQSDIVPKLKFTDKLYGRDTEKQLLRDKIALLQNGKFKIIKISGKAGVGKTSLVNEIIPDIQNSGRIFISGKCSQIDQQIPYQVISELFQDFIHQFLKKPDSKISYFQNNINRDFIKSAKVLTKIIPGLELLTGPLQTVESPGPVESKNRLLVSFMEFIKIISTENTPLIIFIDDLQWIDNSSIDLLQSALFNISDNNHLMIIFAYRQIELALNRNITHFLDSVQNITDLAIDLSPLKKGSIATLLSDTLSCSNEDSYRLSDLILTKTRGNPFYTKFFMENLYNEKFLTFHYSSQTWQWDTISIQTRPGMENVVDLLISGLKKLDNRYIDILSYAACLGEQFDPTTLSIILDIPDSKIEIILDEIADRGYISKYNKKDLYYHFIHDRIQQAAYSLISEKKQISVHLNIARKLIFRTENTDRQLLDIISHYNKGAPQINSSSEIEKLIQLNVNAGKIAREQSAWDAYFLYSASGISLAQKIKHQVKYTTLLQLYKQGIESARLVGNYPQMEKWLEDSKIFARTIADNVLLETERFSALMAQNKMVEVYRKANNLMDLLAVKISKKNKFFYSNLSRKPEKYFTQIQDMEDPLIILTAEIQMLSLSAIYLAIPKKLPGLFTQMIELSISYGKSDYYPFVLVLYGLIHTYKPNKIKYAAKFGRLGMKLCEGTGNSSLQSKVNFAFGSFIQHWFEPIANSFVTLKNGQRIGLENGDFEYAVLSSNLLLFLYFASGKNLQVMGNEKDEQIKFIRKFGYKRSLNAATRTYSIINNLIGKTNSKFSLSYEEIDETEMLKKCKLANDYSAIASFYTYKLMIHYYYCDFKTALEYSEKAEKYEEGLLGQFTYIFLIWFTTLSHLKLLNKSNSGIRFKKIKQNQKLLSYFAEYAPENHRHRVLLIEAELARYREKDTIAINKYDQSIKNAAENGFIQDEALASECAGEFYIDRKNDLHAKAYLSHAYDCYHKWGAIRKLEHLKEKYPFLPDISKIITSLKNIAEQVSRIVDVSSIISASQAISKEIVLRDLIDTVLKIVIQNSGAQKGFLFFADDREELSLKATVYFDNQDYRIELNPSSAVDKERIYSQILLDYTVRSKKTHIIHNAETSAEYSNSTYIQENKIKSVLCLPLLHMGKLTGCIYLENNLSPGIFSTERLEVLKLLAGQIAISLENSRLYESLQQSYSVLQKKEQQNQDQFRQLIQAKKLASLGILAASITHEVSNPNYAIQLNSEFLASSKTDILTLLDEYSSDLKDVQIDGLSFTEFRDKFPKVIDTILNCSRQIDGVIKELKNYARREPEKPMTELQINPLIESTVMMCTGFIEKATSNFSIHLGDNIPTVPGHYQKLQQVLMNLIINACQALAEKSSTLHIESGYNKADHQVQVKIIDQGTGIITDHFEQISKPFFSTKGSMGLGLSISEEIIKLHNGTLKFIPNDNAGTTVIISLPIIEKEILIL